MLEQKYLDMLCCPGCRGDLVPVGGAEELHCAACGFFFPIIDEIPVLFPCNVKENMDDLFGRYWDSAEKATFYADNVEGQADRDVFGKHQNESEILGIERSYDPTKLGVVLDAGCGNGRFLDRLPDHTLKVGVDASLNLLRATRERGRGNLLVCCELEHIPFKDGVFDTVISCRVLQHLVDQDLAVAEMCRITRSLGDVILELYNLWNLKTIYKLIRETSWGSKLNAPFVLIRSSWRPFDPWLPKYDHYNGWREVSGWLRASGMRIADGRGVGFGYHKWLWHPFLFDAVLGRISPRIQRAYYAICLKIEEIIGPHFPFKYTMEKFVIKATK